MPRRSLLRTHRFRSPAILISAASLLAFACATESSEIAPPDPTSGGTSSSGATSGDGGSGLTSTSGGTSSSGATSGNGGTSASFGGSAGLGGSGSGGTTGGTSSSGGTAGSDGGSGGAGGSSGGSGGSGGATGGSAGSGGSGGVPQSVIDAADVVVHTKNDQTGASSSTIFFHFFIENQSDDPLPMANVKVRYWFDPDGNTPSLAHFYQGPSIAGQTDTFHEAGENSYVEMAFTGNTISKGADLNGTEFQIQITGGTYDQTDDWSWTASGTRAPNDKVTVYLDGTLVWGCEPTGACFDDDTGTAGAGGGA